MLKVILRLDRLSIRARNGLVQVVLVKGPYRRELATSLPISNSECLINYTAEFYLVPDSPQLILQFLLLAGNVRKLCGEYPLDLGLWEPNKYHYVTSKLSKCPDPMASVQYSIIYYKSQLHNEEADIRFFTPLLTNSENDKMSSSNLDLQEKIDRLVEQNQQLEQCNLLLQQQLQKMGEYKSVCSDLSDFECRSRDCY